jgi:hypothetical protein
MADVSFVDLQQTVRRIRVDDTGEQFDRAPLKPGADSLRHVLARRNSREVKGPAAIQIWASLDADMPQRIVFGHGKPQGSQQPRRLTFDLIDEAPLPADRFTPTAHIAGKTRNCPWRARSPTPRGGRP